MPRNSFGFPRIPRLDVLKPIAEPTVPAESTTVVLRLLIMLTALVRTEVWELMLELPID